MEFDGVRAPDDVMCDLRSISDAGGSLSDVNAMTRSPGGAPVVTYGRGFGLRPPPRKQDCSSDTSASPRSHPAGSGADGSSRSTATTTSP